MELFLLELGLSSVFFSVLILIFKAIIIKFKVCPKCFLYLKKPSKLSRKKNIWKCKECKIEYFVEPKKIKKPKVTVKSLYK